MTPRRFSIQRTLRGETRTRKRRAPRRRCAQTAQRRLRRRRGSADSAGTASTPSLSDRQMLREDKKARLVQHQGLFGGKRWQFVAPKFEGVKRFKEEEILPLLEHQMKTALPVFNDGGRQLWMFRDRFYWEWPDPPHRSTANESRLICWSLRRQLAAKRAGSLSRSP